MPHFACPTIRGMWNWMTVSDCKCMANLSSAWFSLLPGDPTTTPWNLLDTWKPFALGKTVSDPQEATYPVPGSSISSNSYLSDPLRRHVRSTQWIHMIPLNLPKVSWIEVPECRTSLLDAGFLNCKGVQQQIHGTFSTPENLLPWGKLFQTLKKRPIQCQAHQSVPILTFQILWEDMLDQPNESTWFPWICPKSPESKFLNAALLSWMQGFWTARGSNNKSMEPSRHLKTFCLGENCFRPSWSDLSSARLINQVQTF